MAAANAVADALKPSIAPVARKILDFVSSHEDMNSSATKVSKLAAAAAIAAGDPEGRWDHDWHFEAIGQGTVD